MAFWLNSPTQKIETPKTANLPYNSQFTKGTTIGDLINQVGQYLRPQQAFSNTMGYDTYAAPQREAFNIWEQQSLRPEWERYQLNPFQSQYGNQAAATNQMQLGSGKQDYQLAREQLEQGYSNQLDQARNAYDEMIRGMYEQEMANYYESPTAFTKYSPFPATANTTTQSTIPGIKGGIPTSYQTSSEAKSPYYLSRMTTPISNQNYNIWNSLNY